MKLHPSLILLLAAVMVLGTVHILALELYLYWQYTWFDVPVHMLGGAIVALSLFVAALYVPMLQQFLHLLPVLAFALIVGILWELFELGAGIFRAENYAFDTSIDLVMDVVGGYIGYIVGSRMNRL